MDGSGQRDGDGRWRAQLGRVVDEASLAGADGCWPGWTVGADGAWASCCWTACGDGRRGDAAIGLSGSWKGRQLTVVDGAAAGDGAGRRAMGVVAGWTVGADGASC
ncbi:hypothetical protein ACLOJK_031384 [Asimina triloba]